MSDPLDVHRVLEHCMQIIEAGREAMARDMYDAAMRLGAAEMMLASASHAVREHAAALPQVQTQPGTAAEQGGEGA
jgi:predicted short-subunit dehydrogenase-like oxidoreductase (DUF2520 family)